MHQITPPVPPSQHLVISVIGQKGGSGKTSTAYNLSGCYRERGFPVWVIDTDPQQSLAGILAHAPDPTAWQIIAEGREAGAMPSWAMSVRGCVLSCPIVGS